MGKYFRCAAICGFLHPIWVSVAKVGASNCSAGQTLPLAMAAAAAEARRAVHASFSRLHSAHSSSASASAPAARAAASTAAGKGYLLHHKEPLCLCLCLYPCLPVSQSGVRGRLLHHKEPVKAFDQHQTDQGKQPVATHDCSSRLCRLVL